MLTRRQFQALWLLSVNFNTYIGLPVRLFNMIKLKKKGGGGLIYIYNIIKYNQKVLNRNSSLHYECSRINNKLRFYNSKMQMIADTQLFKKFRNAINRTTEKTA